MRKKVLAEENALPKVAARVRVAAVRAQGTEPVLIGHELDVGPAVGSTYGSKRTNVSGARSAERPRSDASAFAPGRMSHASASSTSTRTRPADRARGAFRLTGPRVPG